MQHRGCPFDVFRGCVKRMTSQQEMIEAEPAAPDRGEHQEHEAVQHRELAHVHDGEEPALRMHREVRDRHLARQQECHDAGEEAEHDQRSANHLQRAREPQLREHVRRRHWRLTRRNEDPKKLLDAMVHEQQSGHDAQERERDVGKVRPQPWRENVAVSGRVVCSLGSCAR